MKINILYLYYDLANLFGEHANIKALVNHFELAGAKTHVDYLTVGDKIDFKKYDIVYLGALSNESETIVLKDMKKRVKEIKEAIENNIYFFVTGTSIEIFGKTITDRFDHTYDALNIFDFYTKYIKIEDYSEECKYRVDQDIEAETDLIDQKIIGFQNRAGLLYDITTPLFRMTKGTGNNLETKDEGFTYKNVYMTHIIGPIFVRNPYLTDYFVEKIILEKDKKFKIKRNKNTLPYITYKKHFEE